MKLVNLTAHAIKLLDAAGQMHIAEPTGTVARVTETLGEPRIVDGVPVPVMTPAVFGAITNLPEPDGESIFIVSMPVRIAAKRADVVNPGTGPSDGAIREPELLEDGTPNPRKGQVIAVTRLNAGA